MMTNPLGAQNGGVCHSMRWGTHLGGALGKRALSPWILGPCDIYLGGWTLDLNDAWVEEHTSWRLVKDRDTMLKRSIRALRSHGTHESSIGNMRGHVPQLDERHLAWDHLEASHHGRGSIGLTACWKAKHLGGAFDPKEDHACVEICN